MRQLTVKDCWSRGFSIEETSERTHYTKRTVIDFFKKYDKEMKKYFLKQHLLKK